MGLTLLATVASRRRRQGSFFSSFPPLLEDLGLLRLFCDGVSSERGRQGNSSPDARRGISSHEVVEAFEVERPLGFLDHLVQPPEELEAGQVWQIQLVVGRPEFQCVTY